MAARPVVAAAAHLALAQRQGRLPVKWRGAVEHRGHQRTLLLLLAAAARQLARQLRVEHGRLLHGAAWLNPRLLLRCRCPLIVAAPPLQPCHQADDLWGARGRELGGC